MPDVNELINALREFFYGKCNSDKKLQSIAQKLAEGMYSDAHDYSVRVGELLSEAFSEVLTEEIYPELTQEIARQIIPSLLGSDHRMISDACVTVQEHLNQNAGIGLKAIEPEFDVSRAYDLADKYVSYDNHEKAKWVLGEPVENYSQSVVDDSIRRNADFQWKAGMSPKIVRKAESGACKWCRSLAGAYDYADVRDVGNDVYRRHENCRCEVTYDPGDGKRQDTHSKIWIDDAERDRRVQRSTDGSLMITGGRITNPDSKRAIEFAESYYESIRHMTADYVRIANNTGYPIEEIKTIKEYLFMNKSLYDEDTHEWRRFDADCRIAQSWQRLILGENIQPHDMTLLRHEIYEMSLKRDNPELRHDEAHTQASLLYNYAEESDMYYDSLKKHSKK